MKKEDYVRPSTLIITFNHMENAVDLDMDSETSFAEAFGMLELAKAILITRWQQANAEMIEQDAYSYDEDLFDDEFDDFDGWEEDED
jgi:hypothetical protein